VDNTVVVCYGDSNTYGFDPRGYLGGRYAPDSRWPDLLASKNGWTVVNEGMNGRRIPRTAISILPDTNLLVIMLGTNDLLQGTSPKQTAEAMECFLQSLSLSADQILLLAPPRLCLGAWVPDQTLIHSSEMLSELYRRLAERLGTMFFDVGCWDLPLAYDGVHLTEESHRFLAEKISLYITEQITYDK